MRQEVGLYRRVDDQGYFEWFEGAIKWKGKQCMISLPFCTAYSVVPNTNEQQLHTVEHDYSELKGTRANF